MENAPRAEDAPYTMNGSGADEDGLDDHGGGSACQQYIERAAVVLTRGMVAASETYQ